MKISVCMATYNGANYLNEQVSSILHQLGKDDELIVVDDGSSDSTLALLRDIGDGRVQIHRNPHNLGPSRSFERALALATGDLVFLSDQDDVWLPGKVAAMAAALRDADLVVSDCQVTDEALNVVHPSLFAMLASGPGLWRNLAHNSYIGCCMALRRGLLQVALPFPARLPMHDWWLGLVCETFGRVTFLPQPLLRHRRHAGNASSTAQPSRATWVTRIRWRVSLAAALVARVCGRAR